MQRRVLRALVVLSGVLVFGTVGYVLVEGWPVLDALYMTVITISTVGFREVATLSPGGKAFTLVLIAAGVGGIVYSFGTLVDFVVEGQFRGLMEGRRMSRRISELRDHYIVVGLGRVGSIVANTLAEDGVPFVVVDSADDRIEAANESGWLNISGDATDEEVLRSAGVMAAKGLVTALDTDADNLFVSLSARTLNPDLYIVARSSTVASEAKILKSGADRVVTPNVIGGRRMAAMVLQPIVSDYLDIVTHGDDIEFRLESMRVPEGSPLAGGSIADGHVRDRTGAYILAVHSGGMLNTNPSPDTRLVPGDELVVLGTRPQLDSLTALLRP